VTNPVVSTAPDMFRQHAQEAQLHCEVYSTFTKAVSNLMPSLLLLPRAKS
jgi:hypothetical protein